MAGNDDSSANEVPEEEELDQSVFPTGPRRSTYTPPPFAAAPQRESETAVDDDALASAMAQDLAATAESISMTYQLDDVAPDLPEGAPITPLPSNPAGARILPADPANPHFADRVEGPLDTPAVPPAGAEPVLSFEPAPSAEPTRPADAPPVDDEPVFEAAPPFEAAPVMPEPTVPNLEFIPGPVPPWDEAPAPTFIPGPVPPWESEPAPVPESASVPVHDLAPETAPGQFSIPESAPEPMQARSPETDSFSVPVPAPEPAPAPAPAPEPALEPDFFSAPAPAYEPSAEVPVFDLSAEDTEPIVEAPPVEPQLDLPPPPSVEEVDEATMLARHSAPAGKPWVPERRSLRDEDLSVLLDAASAHPDGTLGAMAELERQMQLRSIEAQEFREWQESMQAVGTAEALAAVQQVMPAFTEVLREGSEQIAAAATPSAPVPQPVVDAPPPVFDAPPPVFDAPPPVFDAPPPVFNAPPPVFNAPPPAFVEQPLVAQEPPAIPDAWDIPAGTGYVDPSETEEPSETSESFETHESVETNEATFTGLETPTQLLSTQPPALVEPAPFTDSVFTGSISVDTNSIPIITGSIPVATGSFPVTTGSIEIPDQQLDRDIDDDVDATDQVGFDDLLGAAAGPATAPVEPIQSPRIPEDEIVLGESPEESPRPGFVERVTLEPTPDDERVGRAARMFWMWFAPSASLVSVAFGAMVFSLGMSLRQAFVGILAGIAISFIPLGLGVLAGKRSSQPIMVVSRAAFGTAGNIVPAAIGVVSRVFWAAVSLWLLATAVSAVLEGAELTGGLEFSVIAYVTLGLGLGLALLFAVFGYRLIAILQLVVTIAAAALVVGFIALTYSYVDVAAAMTNPDGSWILAGTAAVLVFSFVGLLWANSSGDLARYQRPDSSGGGAMLGSTFGAAIPAFALMAYGALLAASNPVIAAGLAENPFDTFGRMLPVWYPVPLIAAVGLSLISAVVVTMYSGAFALIAVGVRLPRIAALGIIAALTVALAAALLLMSADLTTVFRDFATTMAVPVAAWAGIFAADTMIRTRQYHAPSLLSSGGVYPAVNWVNLALLVVISGVGYGLTTSAIALLSWQGYLFTALGVPLSSELAGTDLGVITALILGLLVPIVSSIPAVRRQEAATQRSN